MSVYQGAFFSRAPPIIRLMHRQGQTARAGVLGLAVGLSCWAAGCGGAAPRRELASGNPLDRARGIVKVSERGDLAAVHKLVDLLEDPDAAVRMYAILALRHLCGQDYGFHYYDCAADRAQAILRWRDALRNGELTPRHAATSEGAEAAAPEPPPCSSTQPAAEPASRVESGGP